MMKVSWPDCRKKKIKQLEKTAIYVCNFQGLQQTTLKEVVNQISSSQTTVQNITQSHLLLKDKMNQTRDLSLMHLVTHLK